jgi:hypothetical protein
MYKNKINSKISWQADFSFHRNSILDFDYDSDHGILYGLQFDFMKCKIVVWLRGDEMPF